MERQKIFWVVLSVSVFVVVVLVAGAFLLRPRPAGSVASTPGTVSPLSDPGTQVYEYQQEVPPGSTSAPTGQGSDNVETQHFYIGEGQGAPSAQGQAVSPGSAAPGPGAPSGAPAASSAVPAPGPAPAAGSAPASAPSKSVTALPRKTTPTKPPAAAKPAPRSTEYWIQTGSYKSQTKAEELAALLDGKGLSGRVFSYDSEGSTWYRVRIGPYTSKGEAGKFLLEVRKLQGLGASYIAQVAPSKTRVN